MNRRIRLVAIGGESARLSHGFGHGPPHVCLAVGNAATLQHDRAVFGPRHFRDLFGQTRLADAGLAEHHRDARTTASEARSERRAQQRDFVIATDEWTAALRRSSSWHHQRRICAKSFDGFFASFCLQRLERFVVDDVARRVVGGGTDYDGAGFRRRLKAARDVHHVAHRRVVATGAHRANEYLAGVDADPEPQRQTGVVGNRRHRSLHRQRTPHGALSVVFVGDRGAEQSHQRVAHDFVDAAPMVGDVAGQTGKTRVHEVLDLLGIPRLRHGGKTHDIGKNHCNYSSFVTSGAQGMATGRTEACVGGSDGGARRTGHSTKGSCCWLVGGQAKFGYAVSHAQHRRKPEPLQRFGFHFAA